MPQESQSREPITPVREGGATMTLQQGADALNDLGLLGEEAAPTETPGPDTPPADDPNERPAPPMSEDDSDGNEDADETSDSQTDDDDAETSEEPETEAEAEAEQEPITTLSQLIDALEADPAFLGQLTDTFKADGEEVTVPLDELRRGYQRDANYRRQTQELAEQRRTMEQEQAESSQKMQRELVQLGQFLQQGENVLIGDVNSAEMTALRQSNPAEWAARREELGQRIANIRGLYQQASQQYDAYQAKQDETVTAEMTARRQKEIERLHSAIPEWDSNLRGAVWSYLSEKQGFSDDDLSTVYDHRLIVLANKARLYDEMQVVGRQMKKKIVNVPKVQKPGTGRKAPDKASVNLKKARQQLKSSGGLRDAADLIGMTLPEV